MPSLIDIIIRATWAGSQATQQAKRDVAGIDDSARKGGRGLQDFATKAGIATAAIVSLNVAADKSFESLERGAGLELTRQRFDRLSESIGTTGDELRDNLSEATSGLISDAQQMALATDLIGLELATTSDQAIRLSRVVTELDQDVGELSLALVNQTTRRFDQLGISAVGFEERLEALKAQGLDTQAAFTEAFLQQAEAQIERVGGVSESSAADLLRFRAAQENIKESSELALVSLVKFSGGFERLESVSENINRVSDGIEKLGDLIDGLGGRLPLPTFFVSDPVGSILNRLIPGGAAIRDIVVQTDAWQGSVEHLLGTINDVGTALGLIPEDMSAVVTEAESFDRVLTRASNTLSEISTKIQDAGIGLRGAAERAEGLGGRSAGTPPIQEFGTIQERVTLFEDFQQDITAINEQYQAERANIEEQYESQRTDIVANYGRQRAEEEEDWNRRRARAERDFQDSLEDVRENAAESEADARSQSQERLEDLSRDHLKRMRDIIDNASLQLTSAASRLDAAGVAEILRQRSAALKKERENYNDQRSEIQDNLDKQLASIRDNMNKRLADLQEFHDKRLEREEEDRQIRLDRLEESHRRELQELEAQYRDRMQDLKEAVRNERREVQRAYIEAYNELTTHWQDRQELEAQWQAQILEQEADWWQQRLALVGGDSDRGDSGTGGAGGTGGGTGGTGGTTDPTRPDRPQLEQLFTALGIQAGYSMQFIENAIEQLRNLTDEAFAQYIERVFNYDVPGYKYGADFIVPSKYTNDSFLFRASAGERLTIKTPEQQRMDFGSRQSNVTINVYPSPGMDEGLFARHVRREFEGLLREVA